MRIAFIVVYFGSVPWYFRLFIKSCAHNPDVDFILVTDIDLKGDVANNIIVVRSSLDEISKRCTDRLGFKINLLNPYKLCDLRPAYGWIFSDLIEVYDFWGYCDIDLVFGNIRSLITTDILNRYEVVTARREYIAGFFSLFRNNKKINTLFKRSKDYRKAFQDPAFYDFDECNWEWGPLLDGKKIWELRSEVESITHIIKHAERAGEIAVFWHTMESHPGKLVWDRGALLNSKGQQLLLCHFIFFKQLNFTYVPKWKTIPGRFYINSFYLSRYAPGSLTDRGERFILTTARLLNEGLHIVNQRVQWVLSYLVASRRIDLKEVRSPTVLEGYYKSEKSIIRVFIINDRLHVKMNGSQFPLWHKRAGKFVLAKYKIQDQNKLQQLINMQFNFQFNEYASVNTLLVITGTTFSKRIHFFKIS
jgi:hypothetical protein